MSITKKWHGAVKGGKFKPQDSDFSKAFYHYEGKEVTVTIARRKKTRSNNQNGYLHGVVYKILSEHLGYNPDEIHDLMRIKFWFKFIGDIKIPKSTTKMSTLEFESYCSNVRTFASIDLGCYIPLPNEVNY